MKALYATKEGNFGLVERPLPKPKSNEVLIKVNACGICHTDLIIRAGKALHATYPFVPGHEFGGVIEKCGSEVDHLKVGDRGVVQQITGCGYCRACRDGYEVECESYKELGCMLDGGMAEFCALPARCFLKMPDDLSFEEATLTEPLACATFALFRTGIRIGETVVVIGPGPIGIMAAKVAQYYGAGRVVIVGTRDKRLQLCKDWFGATDIINIKEKGSLDRLKNDLLQGKGADSIIDCSGTLSGLQTAFSILGMSGRLALESTVEIDETVPFCQARLPKNASIYNVAAWRTSDFKTAFELIAQKRIEAKRLITHVVPLKDWEHGFELVTSRKDEAIKVVLKP